MLDIQADPNTHIKVSYNLSTKKLQWYNDVWSLWKDVGTTELDASEARFFWSKELSDTPVTIKTVSSGGHVPLSETEGIGVTLAEGGGDVEFKAVNRTYNGYITASGHGHEVDPSKPKHRAPPPRPQLDPPPRVGRSGGEAPTAADELGASSSTSDPDPRPPRVGR